MNYDTRNTVIVHLPVKVHNPSKTNPSVTSLGMVSNTSFVHFGKELGQTFLGVAFDSEGGVRVSKQHG